jgi:hypothetical protein
MDILWQYNDPSDPSEAAIGPQAYDHHLYYRLVRYTHSLSCTLTDVSLLAVAPA